MLLRLQNKICSKICDPDINCYYETDSKAQLRDFRQQGGFAENLTQTRIEARREKAADEGSPACPQCGKPMLLRTIQRGTRQGQRFWGCGDYPRCNGTRPAEQSAL